MAFLGKGKDGEDADNHAVSALGKPERRDPQG
jgi:hypothetical protein